MNNGCDAESLSSFETLMNSDNIRVHAAYAGLKFKIYHTVALCSAVLRSKLLSFPKYNNSVLSFNLTFIDNTQEANRIVCRSLLPQK